MDHKRVGSLGIFNKLSSAASQKCPLGKYAKIVRVYTTVSARGFKATVTLPSSKTNNNPGDFINFYCAVAGFECGLSTKAPQTQWGWFVNAADRSEDRSVVPEYSDGITKIVALYIGSDNKIRFEVDGEKKFTSASTYNTVPGNQPTSSVRFVVGAAQVVNSCTDPNEYKAPWRIYHNQVLVDKMQYRDTENVWRAINTSNSKFQVSHLPESIIPPEPINYTTSDQRGNSQFYASLKRQ